MRQATFSLLLGSMLIASGCTATGADPAAVRAVEWNECEQIDCEKMQRERRHAREQGVILIWVNPPRRLPVSNPEGG